MFYSDDPLENPKDDRLGYRQFAGNLAEAIFKNRSEKGIVIGISGPWGTGKTTVRNFVVHYLREKNKQVIVVPFNAWWFSGREELLKALYGSLSKALTDAHFPPAVTNAAKNLGHAIGAIPMPVIRGKGKDVVAPIGHLLFGDFAEMSKQKKELAKQLSAEKRQIIFTVDDLDRLGADELSQIFRVVTEIADLPYVTYLLTFDKKVVSSALEDKLCPSGDDYLEKVIQVPFQVPAIDRDMYRTLFFNELDKALVCVSEDLINAQRMYEIYHNGLESLLSSPRRIFRLLNALAVTLPPVAKEVDPIDFLCIESFRLYCQPIYERIQKFSFYFSGGIASRLIDVQKRKTFYEEAMNLVEEHDRQSVESILGYLFPDFAESRGIKVGSLATRSELQDSVGVHQDEKLPIYFQFSIPGWGVSADEAIAIISLGDNAVDFKAALDALKRQKRPDGSTRLSSFLERASDLVPSLPLREAKQLVMHLILHGDELLLLEDFGANRLAIPYGNEMPIERAIFSTLEKMEMLERKPFLLGAITPSASLGILCHLIYTLGRAHGKYQGEKGLKEQLVTINDLNTLEKKLLKLIRVKASNGSLLNSKELKLVLMCWRYWDSEKVVRDWIEGVIDADDGLLRLLENFFENSAIRSDCLAWHLGNLDVLKKRAKAFVDQPLTSSQKKSLNIFLDKDRERAK
jgi:predicted KAP-like P-loop ATPase